MINGIAVFLVRGFAILEVWNCPNLLAFSRHGTISRDYVRLGILS